MHVSKICCHSIISLSHFPIPSTPPPLHPFTPSFSTSPYLPPPSTPPSLPPPSTPPYLPPASPPPPLPSPPPRDRVSLIWGDVSLHLSRLVLISEHDSYLRERALVGLLKIVNRLTNRDDVRSEVRTGWQFEQFSTEASVARCVPDMCLYL